MDRARGRQRLGLDLTSAAGRPGGDLFAVGAPRVLAAAGIFGVFVAIPFAACFVAVSGAIVAVLRAEDEARGTTDSEDDPSIPTWLDRLGLNERRPLAALQEIEPRITKDALKVLSVERSVASRTSLGGTAPKGA